MIWKKDEAGGDDAIKASAGAKNMAEQGGEVTIIGQGAKLEGTLVSAGSLRIDGSVKGMIEADGDVMLSAQSQVDADIKANNVAIAGRFKGDLTVRGTAELARGGRIEGNITSKTLVIQEGGVFSGQSIMNEGSGTSAASAQASHGTGAKATDGNASSTSNAAPAQGQPAAAAKPE